MQREIKVAVESPDGNARLLCHDDNGKTVVFAHIGNSDFSSVQNQAMAHWICDAMNNRGSFPVPELP